MRLLWASNAGWANTGYGTQTDLMLDRLLADGHEVAVASNYGLHGGVRSDDRGVTVFPQYKDLYGNDIIPAHAAYWQADWIITLYDVWVYDPARFAPFRVASWTPIDHIPVPPRVAEWARSHTTIAMSRFGEKALRDSGADPRYAPHAIDTKVLRRTDDRAAVRASLGVPDDAFLVMINAANKGNTPVRKAWGEMLQALAMLFRERPDAYAYIHTDLEGHNGISLPVLFAALGLDRTRVKTPDQYLNAIGRIGQDRLASLYSAADVLLATSKGEGFGIPVIEAQACGLPVIVTDFSAQPELVGAGWKVGYQPEWDFTQAAWIALPLVSHIKRALDEAYERRGEDALREGAIAKAAEYDADRVYAEHWRPILADLEEQLKPEPVRRGMSNAAKRRRRKAA